MRKKLPDTIKHPETFLRGMGEDFDGVFDWSWTAECWPNPRDKPMDIDGFKERRGHCLFFETKDPGVDPPLGQMIGLKSLWEKPDCSVMLIWGKLEPLYGQFWFENSSAIEYWEGRDHAVDLVRRWYQHANGGKT